MSASHETNRALRVLAVEDDESLREVYRALLEEAGHDVRVAENGRAALAVLDWHPDLIMLDLMLPVMDGYEFLRRLRLMPTGNHVPVLVLSAVIPPGRESIPGADRVLRKPFDFNLLMQTVQAYARRARTN